LIKPIPLDSAKYRSESDVDLSNIEDVDRVWKGEPLDEYTVPVCRLHHRDLRCYGDEASWWAVVDIDPLPIALVAAGRS
jgi:hypothetical protein